VFGARSALLRVAALKQKRSNNITSLYLYNYPGTIPSSTGPVLYSVWNAIFVLFSSGMGAGLLGLPKILKVNGSIFGCVRHHDLLKSTIWHNLWLCKDQKQNSVRIILKANSSIFFSTFLQDQKLKKR
jgi:hypothetical protein